MLLNAPIDRQIFMIVFGSMLIWSITSFIVYEDGPFDIFRLFRDWLGVRRDKLTGECTGKNIFAKMVCCFKCTSFWVAIPIAYLMVSTQPLAMIALILVLRTGACLVDRIING